MTPLETKTWVDALTSLGTGAQFSQEWPRAANLTASLAAGEAGGCVVGVRLPQIARGRYFSTGYNVRLETPADCAAFASAGLLTQADLEGWDAARKAAAPVRPSPPFPGERDDHATVIALVSGEIQVVSRPEDGKLFVRDYDAARADPGRLHVDEWNETFVYRALTPFEVTPLIKEVRRS